MAGVSAQGLSRLTSGSARAGLSPGARAPLPSILAVAESSSFGCRINMSIISWLSPRDCSQLLEAAHIPTAEGMGRRAKAMLMDDFWVRSWALSAKLSHLILTAILGVGPAFIPILQRQQLRP